MYVAHVCFLRAELTMDLLKDGSVHHVCRVPRGVEVWRRWHGAVLLSCTSSCLIWNKSGAWEPCCAASSFSNSPSQGGFGKAMAGLSHPKIKSEAYRRVHSPWFHHMLVILLCDGWVCLQAPRLPADANLQEPPTKRQKWETLKNIALRLVLLWILNMSQFLSVLHVRPLNYSEFVRAFANFKVVPSCAVCCGLSPIANSHLVHSYFVAAADFSHEWAWGWMWWSLLRGVGCKDEGSGAAERSNLQGREEVRTNGPRQDSSGCLGGVPVSSHRLRFGCCVYTVIFSFCKLWGRHRKATSHKKRIYIYIFISVICNLYFPCTRVASEYHQCFESYDYSLSLQPIRHFCTMSYRSGSISCWWSEWFRRWED